LRRVTSNSTNTHLTALMPLKNYHEDYLRRAVQSVTNQTCPDWYLLIIVEKEDFDYFAGLLGEQLEDTRITVAVNVGRKLAGALNTGMRQAVTDFVAILSADDLWTRDAVEVLTDYRRKFPDVDFFHSSRRYIDERDEPISSVYRSRESFTLDEFFLSPPIKHLLCWRRVMALSFGGMDESLNSVGPDDYDFPWCMAERGAVFKAIAECLYLYREHLDSYRLTTHLPLSLHKREIKRIMKKHGASAWAIHTKLRQARASYLRQCVFRSKFDEWIKRKLGYDVRRSWRRPEYH
jgi:glycosyltransferase involved in cell wall biosynthesis